MNTNQLFQRSFSDIFLDLWSQIVEFLPSFIIGLALLIVGYWLAKLARAFTSKIAQRLGAEKLGNLSGANQFIEPLGIQSGLSGLLAGLMQIFVFLGFALAALEVWGLNQVSETVGQFLFFIPRVLAAGAILLFGFWLAQIIYKGTKTSADTFGVDSSRAIASLVRAVVILVSLSLAIAQLDIDVSLLNMLISGLIAAIGVAIALSFGLGTREYSREVVAGVYVKDQFKRGDHIKLENIEGTIKIVDSVCTQIETDQGIVSIPNSKLLKQPVTRILE